MPALKAETCVSERLFNRLMLVSLESPKLRNIAPVQNGHFRGVQRVTVKEPKKKGSNLLPFGLCAQHGRTPAGASPAVS